MSQQGCSWVVRTWNDKRGDKHYEVCGRISSATSAYCPKHELMDAERENEEARRKHRLESREKWKKRNDEAIIPEIRPTGYEA